MVLALLMSRPNSRYQEQQYIMYGGNGEMPTKWTIEDCQKIAKEHGGRCLSEKYINARTKIEWECSKGHGWTIALDSVGHGSWCNKCAIIARSNTIDICRTIAKKHNGFCLSSEYKNANTKDEMEMQQRA